MSVLSCMVFVRLTRIVWMSCKEVFYWIIIIRVFTMCLTFSYSSGTTFTFICTRCPSSFVAVSNSPLRILPPRSTRPRYFEPL